ncbi:MAG: nickel-dependent hydrogenase large subunit [Gammaproteobacteria bacterium]
MTEQRELGISVPVLARVEGEGALELSIRDGAIEKLQLRIYEPPRLFEKFLEGRGHQEVPDLVARICGICPVAYQMSAVHALERVLGVDPGPHIRAWRRLFYCGEWIQSHALHIHLLAAPDFLGFNSVTEMARVYPAEVRRGLRLQAVGNDLIALLGARSVHPVGACVGGFHCLPKERQIRYILDKLHSSYDDAEGVLAWAAGLDLPDEEQEFTCVSLQHPQEYAMNEGRIVSDTGLDIPIESYEHHFEETQSAHSTALCSALHGEPYLVGPLARLNLNQGRLPEPVRRSLETTGIRFPSHNMFHSIVARAAEILFAVREAARILEAGPDSGPARVPVTPRSGTGFGCTEAPRGLLWHRYEVAEDGRVRRARIVPPTSQNQTRLEQDLKASLEAFGLDRDEPALRLRAETVIRNYDPCISCATHFLRLKIERPGP